MYLTKLKKYQYLYLQQKIKSRNLTLNWFDYDNHQWFYERECKRLDCLNSWLDKINKKYNYI